MINWDEIKIRCSCINAVMVDGQGSKPITEVQLSRLEDLDAKDKRFSDGLGKALTDKQRSELAELITRRDFPPEPKLGEVAKSYLMSVYVEEVYGRRTKFTKDKAIKYTKKGTMVEEDSIKLLSKVDGKKYTKNDQRIQNDFITGELDIFEGENIRKADKIIDIKSSWDLDSLQMTRIHPLNPQYWWQMQGYLALSNAPRGEIAHCLVNAPSIIIEDEKRRLLHAMCVATEENPEYIIAAAQLEYDMVYDDIPEIERVVRHMVERDEAAIERVYKRVELCRKWLREFTEFAKINVHYIKSLDETDYLIR